MPLPLFREKKAPKEKHATQIKPPFFRRAFSPVSLAIFLEAPDGQIKKGREKNTHKQREIERGKERERESQRKEGGKIWVNEKSMLCQI